MPDWFSWENQGAGIPVVDVDGDGQLELVVLLVDNPSQQNQGFYQLGRGLGADGTVTGWTGWLGIPGWHSWENQGADVATARLEGRRPGSAATGEASTNSDASNSRHSPAPSRR